MTSTNGRRWGRSLTWFLGALVIIALLACNKGGRYEDEDDGEGPPTFSVGGTIVVANNTSIDIDTNDEGAIQSDNDNFGLAQELPVPVALGGYVNQPRQGEEGASFTIGDPSDFYRANLNGGQVVRLRFPAHPLNRLHLYLYDTERRLVDASQSDGNTQSLTVAAQGTYYLEVYAQEGGSNYTLTLNLADLSTTAETAMTTTRIEGEAPLRLSDDFVPGEALILMTLDEAFEETSGEGGAANSLAAALAPMGLDAVAGTESGGQGPQLIHFETGTRRDTTLHRKLEIETDDVHRSRIDPTDKLLLAKWDTLEMVRSLRAQPGIQNADPNYRRYAFGRVPDDPYFGLQWHYPLINLPNAWEQTTGGSDVLVAVVDTGVLLDHPDLADQLVFGYDFISDTDIANDGDGQDDDPSDSGDSLEGKSSYHGTHVAGTIAALSDNGDGVSGAGWQTRVMPLRVLGVGGGTSNDLIQAMRYAAGLANEAGVLPTQKADIINLSLGGSSFSSAEQQTIEAVRSAGLIVVAAAGNSGSTAVSYPAGYEGVISVSAVDSQAELADYSSFGTSVDIAAPGGNTGVDLDGDSYPDGVLSTCGEELGGNVVGPPDLTYCFQQGTSMAAPHVSAVAALMKAVDPDMTPEEFDARLISGELTRDLGTDGWDEAYGYGLIDAYRSVLSASADAPTVLLVEPPQLSFERTETNQTIIVSRVGDDPLAILSVSSDADWIAVTGQTLDENGLGTYSITVDRTGLADGIYHGSVILETNSETQSVPLEMPVLAETTAGDLAHHYVLLIDSTSQELVQLGEAQQNSNGSFNITGVPAGSYYLYAGTDMDYDGYVGDPGEAYGAYLSLDNPVILNINGNRSDLLLNTAFRLTLPTKQAAGELPRICSRW